MPAGDDPELVIHARARPEESQERLEQRYVDNLAAPTVLVAAWLYSVWSTKGALLTMVGVTSLGLGALLLRGTGLFPGTCTLTSCGPRMRRCLTP